ncbi:MAG TPA: hypothetical protein VFN28_09020 [Amaricoccus sp.]|jgi:hypothetical protein|nr:hypothetical protein [Amaricoccus sp.]
MHQRRGGTPALLLLALLAACSRDAAPPLAEGEFRIRFEDRAEPAAFSRAGTGVRDGEDGAAGLWVAVRGLPRPERALIETGTGRKSVVAALFAAPRGGPDIRLSNAVADALGITREGAVRITALRSEPQIDTTESRFPALPAWPSGGTGTREPTR